MIRIVRPIAAPAVLTQRGASATRQLCDEIDNGARDFEPRSDIYGDPEVRTTLETCQHAKCCFCESLIHSGNHVEHFRPKKAVHQHRDEPLIKPGYYWLTYEWTNLLLACPVCNGKHKKNLFPLEDPASRATHPDHDLARERPLLIDPAVENPEGLLAWNGLHVTTASGDVRAKTTIAVLGLNRDGLVAARRQRLGEIRRVLNILRSSGENSEVFKEAEEFLREATAPPALFSAMVSAFLRQEGFSQVTPSP